MIKGLSTRLAYLGIAFATVSCSGATQDPNAVPESAGGTTDTGGAAGGAGAAGVPASPDAGNTGGDSAGAIGAPDSALSGDAAPADAGPSPDFHFDSFISKTVLENYLSRSISFTELLHDDLTQPVNARGVDPHDNIRLLISSKAKFVGRALMLWGSEQNLATYLTRAKPYIDALHQADPDLVLQAAAFEIVTTN